MKIIVLGSGLVPRHGGIAPIRTPFETNETQIRLILGQGFLKPYKVGDDGTRTAVTYQNYKKLLEADNAPKKVEQPKAPVAEKKDNQSYYNNKKDKKNHSNAPYRPYTPPVQKEEEKKPDVPATVLDSTDSE